MRHCTDDVTTRQGGRIKRKACKGIIFAYHYQLHIGRTQAFLLSMSDFKFLTSFGFLIQNFTEHCLDFIKPQNELVWPIFTL